MENHILQELGSVLLVGADEARGELVNRVMYDCQQFHAGFGYMREAPIERLVRDARIQSIGGGATEVMLEEIAKHS